MTHTYHLIDILDTGALRLRCPECGRQIRVSPQGTGRSSQAAMVVEEDGGRLASHRFSVPALMMMTNVKLEDK